ncbi:TIGR03364 family FAD-dependent oxidoreductase [Pseudonocardia ailaonensis]|uniref:TIGR03364 family FAD-dependent oxidoreductase n=1 Tax=Pseudonocardia ailaonensis TaxID=367279 RepID=A0ABN2N5Y0_9PSEU
MRVVVVGAGILGTAHAWQAVLRGHEVVHLEREREARGASVRNFGLVWVSGRSPAELPAALRSRELWEKLGADVPGIGFRPNGSLTLVRTPAELAVAEEVIARADAADRGVTLLEPDEVRRRNPALRGEFLAGLHCERDAAVESRVALPALRAHLAASGRYTFHAGREVVGIDGGTVVDDLGGRHGSDLILLCTGAALGGLVRELVGELPVRRVRLQMMQTEPLGEELTTSLADGDSFRYYPAYAGAALDRLQRTQPQTAVAAAHRMQLLCVQRLHGGLTIGDTHAYDEPFDFDLDDAPYRHLTEVVEGLLGRPLPAVTRRWSGVYAQATTPDELVQRARTGPVHVVTGPGGRGMTLGPALGEATADLIGL